MKKNIFIISILLAISLLVAGCDSQQAGLQGEGTPTAQVTAHTAAIPTSAPTATSTPAKVLLYAPADINVQPVQDTLAGLSAASGLILENRAELRKEDLGTEVKVVFLASVPENLAELLAAAPQVQFIAVSASDLPAAGNLTVLRQRPENQAFLAGFITSLLSPDYRSAGLLPADGPLGASMADVFVNGGKYYCGVCTTGWPIVYYPQTAVLPAASDGPTWQGSAARLFDEQKADVFYLAPETVRTEVLAYLQGRVQFDRTVLLVGERLPAEELRAQWAASVRFDIATPLNEVWPEVTAGQGGRMLEAPLVIEDVNEDLLGPGRFRLVEELMADLAAGKVYPFTLSQQ